MKTRDIAYTAVLCALASVLGYAESLLPPIIPIAGFRAGLSNIAVMYALLCLGGRRAFFVMLVKVFVSAVWFSGFGAFLYSLCGGVFALFAMLAAQKAGMMCRGIGMCGGVFHNIGQLLAACIMLKSAAVITFAPALLILGLVSGFIVAAVTSALLAALKHYKKH